MGLMDPGLDDGLWASPLPCWGFYGAIRTLMDFPWSSIRTPIEIHWANIGGYIRYLFVIYLYYCAISNRTPMHSYLQYIGECIGNILAIDSLLAVRSSLLGHAMSDKLHQ
jgi:hypothetical protein